MLPINASQVEADLPPAGCSAAKNAAAVCERVYGVGEGRCAHAVENHVETVSARHLERTCRKPWGIDDATLSAESHTAVDLLLAAGSDVHARPMQPGDLECGNAKTPCRGKHQDSVGGRYCASSDEQVPGSREIDRNRCRYLERDVVREPD